MKIFLSGHYSNDFLYGVISEAIMKVCLVNVSTTAGVVSNCISSIFGKQPLKDINKEAMKIFLAGGYQAISVSSIRKL